MDPDKILILDSSAFIAGLDPLNLNQKLFTTPDVMDELSMTWIQLRCSTAVYLKKLTVKNPQRKFLCAAQKMSTAVGDHLKLSKADISILALALELKSMGGIPSIISDDFSIQNVAEHLEIDYAALPRMHIKSRIRWIWYCPACGRRTLSAERRVCPVCGTETKRKPLTKTPVENRRVKVKGTGN